MDKPYSHKRFWDDPGLISPQCNNCRHRIVHTATCSAFPNRIPVEILLNKFIHTSPYDGDNGILFEEKID